MSHIKQSARTTIPVFTPEESVFTPVIRVIASNTALEDSGTGWRNTKHDHANNRPARTANNQPYMESKS